MPTPDSLSNIGIVQVSPTPPAVGINGDLWYNPENGIIYISQGGSWVETGTGGSSAPIGIHVGPTAPGGSELIWVDNSRDTITVSYWVDGLWDQGLDGGFY